MKSVREGKILVTGATGFVGTRLLHTFEQTGEAIRALYRRRENDTALGDNIEWRLLDLSAPDAVYSQAVKGCRAVVHLAGQAHDPSADDANYELLNHTVTRRLAQVAAANDVSHFIFISTIKVNGGDYEFIDRAYSEIDRVFPQGHYGESKWHGEQALREVCDTSAMRCTILRPPLIYGPGVKANFLSLMNLVRHRVPLPLAAIRNRRSLIYVDNLCDVICKSLESDPRESSTYLVSDNTLSTPELIYAMAEGLGIRAHLFPVPVPLLRLTGRMVGKRSMIDRLTKSLVVDDSAVRRELDWQPPVSLEQGMWETAEWFLEKRRG